MSPTQKSTGMSLFMKNIDLVLVVLVVVMIVTIFIPMSSLIIDGLLIISITVSILILMTSIYVKEPLQFSVFPSLLLVTTFFRLALNIATTRLILVDTPVKGLDAAGTVIRTFGEFVALNQPGVGFVLFLVIIIIQFVVITKGANRISEVAARFTLDAMPGKQMSIDADLNAGLIKESEARERRAQISREADFYGAMDGATKFVRGDAIAGVIITALNIVVGIILGVLDGMSISEALKTYTILTIGDGLVSQIPALIISVSAGLLVTRNTAESSLGKDVVGQILTNTRVIYIAAAFLAILIVTPLPKIPVAATVAILVFIGWSLNKHKIKEGEKAVAVAKDREIASRKPEKVETLLYVDPMELEIGYSLIKLVDPSSGGDLLDRVTMIRRQTALELGIIIPPVRIRDNMQLESNQYVIKIRGVTVAASTCMPDYFLAMDSGLVSGDVEGIQTTEPAFNLPAKWITEAQKQRAEVLGYTVVDAITVITTHLSEIIKAHAPEIITREDVNALMNNVKETNPHLVEEVVPTLLKAGEVQKVLQNLLREGVSVRDMVTILETLGDYAPRTKDPEILTEYVRNSLSRNICHGYVGRNGKMHVVTVDPKLEDLIKSSIERTETGSFVNLQPAVLNKFLESASKEIKKLVASGNPPVVLTSPQIRFQLKRIFESVRVPAAVLSYNEVSRDAQLEAAGMISIEA